MARPVVPALLRLLTPLLFTTVLLVGAVMPAAAQTTTASGPVAVVNQLVDAVNRRDWAAAEALFTPQAVAIGGPCENICQGPAAIVREGIMVPPEVTQRVQIVGTPEVSVDRVTARIEVTFGPVPPEVAPGGTVRLIQLNSFLIEDNRIAAWSAVDDLADPQTQALNRMFASFPDPSRIPEEWIAEDGQTLLMQSPSTQIDFLTAHGQQAHVRWAQEHSAALRR